LGFKFRIITTFYIFLQLWFSSRFFLRSHSVRWYFVINLDFDWRIAWRTRRSAGLPSPSLDLWPSVAVPPVLLGSVAHRRADKTVVFTSLRLVFISFLRPC